MNPSYYQPSYYQQPIQGLVKVTGIEGARAYQMPPNSVMPLFDGNQDVFYVRSTDGAGFPTVKAFRFEPIDMNPQPAQAEYVTKADFERFVAEVKGALGNGKQPVPAE